MYMAKYFQRIIPNGAANYSVEGGIYDGLSPLLTGDKVFDDKTRTVEVKVASIAITPTSQEELAAIAKREADAVSALAEEVAKNAIDPTVTGLNTKP